MTFKDVARELCRREAKKRQVSIAQMYEVLHHLRAMIGENPLEVLRAITPALRKDAFSRKFKKAKRK